MPALSAIIVNYNGGRVLLDTIASLPAAGIQLKAAILLDNSSTDGSHREASRKFPGLTLLETGEELSFAAANNLGLKFIAKQRPPRAVLFLNNDVILKPGCVKRLMETLSSDDSLGAAAPIIYDPKGRLWYGGGAVDWKEAGGRLFGQGLADKPRYHRPARVSFASLCVLLVSWKALQKVGLLDETYYFYDEDLEICLRLKRGGFGIAYEPLAEAVHFVGHSTAFRGNTFVYHNMARNRLLTMREYGRPGRWAVFVPYFGTMMAYKAIKFILRGRPQVSAAIFSGLMRGILDRPVPVSFLPEEKRRT